MKKQKDLEAMPLPAMDITRVIAGERRHPLQIGSDADYEQVTESISRLLTGIIIVVAALVVLSMVVTVEEVARARGEFTPVQRVQVIQTPEGGAIAEILVSNDQLVQRGDVIARFRASDLVSDLQRTDLRLAYLQINTERLDAFAMGREPDFSEFASTYPTLVQEAQSLHQEQTRSLTRSLEQKDREIDEQRSALAAAQRELPAAESSLNASRALLERTRQGVNEGLLTLDRLATIEEQAAQSERVYTQLSASFDQIDARINRLEAERDALLANSAATARGERADLLEQFSELGATQAAFQVRSGDIEVRAPVTGIVQGISETPIGTVIQPGGTVCEIVPTEGGVLMQARVSPRDIGFIRIDQRTLVKSDAFDYSRFGSIPGRVVRIAAANTQENPNEQPYIRVEIELDQPYVGDNPDRIVTPGMTGEATILTGGKTIFQYLLKPIYTTLDNALQER